MADHDLLEDHLSRAEGAIDAAAGSASLCSLSRSGTPMPGIKYPEGAWVALREVRRERKTGVGLALAIQSVRDRWARELTRHLEAASGPDWISYLTGGLDALDELTEGLVQDQARADGQQEDR